MIGPLCRLTDSRQRLAGPPPS